MAGQNVLTSFLVGIGWDLTDFKKGQREIESGMQGVKTTALSVSAAILGVYGAVGTAVVKTAGQVDQLNTSMSNMRTGTGYAFNLGNAFKLLGGEAGDALKLIENVEVGLNNLKKGDASWIEGLALSGIDVSGINAQSNPEAVMGILADQIKGMDAQRRELAQRALGTTPAGTRVLAQGSAGLDAQLAEAQRLTGDRTGLGEGSREFEHSLTELGLRVDGVATELTEKFLPALNSAAHRANELFDLARPGISKGIDFAAEHPTETATLGTSAAAATIGAGVSAALARFGFGTAAAGAGLVSKAGLAGVTVSASTLAAAATNRALSAYLPGYNEASAGFDDFLKGALGVDHIVTPSELLFGAPALNQGNTPDDMTGQWYQIDRSGQQYDPSSMPTPRDDSTRRELDDLRSQIDSRAAAPQAPVKVENHLTVQLAGQALEATILETVERQNYQTISDVQSTTRR